MQWCNTDHQQSIKVLIVGKEGSASGERTQNINLTEVRKSTTSDKPLMCMQPDLIGFWWEEWWGYSSKKICDFLDKRFRWCGTLIPLVNALVQVVGANRPWAQKCRPICTNQTSLWFQSSNAISVIVRLAMSTKTPYYAGLFNKLGEDLKSCWPEMLKKWLTL